VENESHPVNEWFRETEAFDNYALNMKLTKLFFIRALEACATLDVVLNMVEKARRKEHPPLIGNNMDNTITEMMAVSKGAGTARLKVELEQTTEKEGLQEFTRKYTDGSVMEVLEKGMVFGNMRPRKNKNQISETNVHIQR
jgi:hypothetical protein